MRNMFLLSVNMFFFLLSFFVDERDDVLFSCSFLWFCFFVEWLSLHWWLIRLFSPSGFDCWLARNIWLHWLHT